MSCIKRGLKFNADKSKMMGSFVEVCRSGGLKVKVNPGKSKVMVLGGKGRGVILV